MDLIPPAMRGGDEVSPLCSRLRAMANIIEQQLTAHNEDLSKAIERRSLYFRVSIIGVCNLSCTFCHNEGAPAKGKLNAEIVGRAVELASDMGFRRVQFTGGEPLLHPRVSDFVSLGRRFVSDVGITTNGTYLKKKFHSIIDAGVTRIHVSLQAESLWRDEHRVGWAAPDWLQFALERAKAHGVFIRLNLPVLPEHIHFATSFIADVAEYGCDLQLFSILPIKSEAVDLESESHLVRLANAENRRRVAMRLRGRITVRGYLAPSGVRCSACVERAQCKEQSHSLRLGSDLVIRPCLATRAWDIRTDASRIEEDLRVGALLALDYTSYEQLR